MSFHGEENPDRNTVRYSGSIEVAKHLLTESSRAELEQVIRLECEGLRRDMETVMLKDWDEIHKDPLADFAKLLNKGLAEQRRRHRA